MNESRKHTDVEVFCVQCGASVGYVVKEGHRAWLCEACGGGKMTAVEEQDAWPRYPTPDDGAPDQVARAAAPSLEQLREAIQRLEAEAYMHGVRRPDANPRMKEPYDFSAPSKGTAHHAARAEVNAMLDAMDAPAPTYYEPGSVETRR